MSTEEEYKELSEKLRLMNEINIRTGRERCFNRKADSGRKQFANALKH